MRRALVAAMILAGGLVVAAQSDWRQPFDPVHIVGNVYYVRTNVERLGFHLNEIKLLLAGHAHYDHIGGQAELKRLTGAQTVAMDADVEAIESGVDRSP